MSDRLAGKVALISGAASGIGANIAKVFGSEGAAVIVTDVNEAAGSALAEEFGDNGIRAAFHRLDVRSPEDWKRVTEAAESRFGPVDVLVSNAFVISHPAIAELDPQEWTRSLDVNLTGALHGVQALLPGMRERKSGNIVIVSATNGNKTTLPAQVGYQAAKAALTAIARHVAVTYGHEGIRANSLLPGGTDTPMLRREGIFEMSKELARNFPIPRLGQPHEIATAALFLASDESAYVTGTELVVDGGASVGITPAGGSTVP